MLINRSSGLPDNGCISGGSSLEQEVVMSPDPGGVDQGLVVLQQGHTVWVSLRSRLLKCNSDQLRAASHEEAVGLNFIGLGS